MKDHKNEKQNKPQNHSKKESESNRAYSVRLAYAEGMEPDNASIPVEYCDKCDVKMIPNKGLRVNKNGTGKRYYVCPVCKAKLAVKINVITQPDFILIPDNEDTISRLCEKVAECFGQMANACWYQDCEEYGYRKWTETNDKYFQSQARYPDVLKKDEWVDHLLDVAFDEALTKEQVQSILRMVYWAAWGQKNFGSKQEMVDRLNGKYKIGDVWLGREVVQVEFAKRDKKRPKS